MKKGFEIAADLTEVAVKSQLFTGIAKDIPYVSTLLKVWNVSDSIRDCMFAAKVMRFLESLDDVTGEEREEMSDKIKYLNQEDLDNVTNKILFSIESITDIDKSEFIANIFIAYIYKEISEKDLRRCIDIIQVTFLDDLKVLIVTPFLKDKSITDMEFEAVGLPQLKTTQLFSPYVSQGPGFKSNTHKLRNMQTYVPATITVKFIEAFNFGKSFRQSEFT